MVLASLVNPMDKHDLSISFYLLTFLFAFCDSKSYLACSETNFPEVAIECTRNVNKCNKSVMLCQEKEGYVKPGMIKSVNHDPEVYNCIRKVKDVFVKFQNKLAQDCLCEQTEVCSSSGVFEVCLGMIALVLLLT